MKQTILITMIVLILAGCSGKPDANSVQEPLKNPAVSIQDGVPNDIPSLIADYLNTDFEDATSIKNQLAYGTLLLEDTDFAISPEQAEILLPLYQAITALSGTSSSIPEEINAVQDQIVENMTLEQMNQIAEMQITSTELNAFYIEKGVTMPSLTGTSTSGTGSGGGMGKNLDQASREATRTAMGITDPASGQGTGQQGRTLLFDEVIALLIERMAEGE